MAAPYSEHVGGHSRTLLSPTAVRSREGLHEQAGGAELSKKQFPKRRRLTKNEVALMHPLKRHLSLVLQMTLPTDRTAVSPCLIWASVLGIPWSTDFGSFRFFRFFSVLFGSFQVASRRLWSSW